eukprot:2803823-Alexandrium_andersonii.AAC.1
MSGRLAALAREIGIQESDEQSTAQPEVDAVQDDQAAKVEQAIAALSGVPGVEGVIKGLQNKLSKGKGKGK